MKRLLFIAMIVFGIACLGGIHSYQRSHGIEPIQEFIPDENRGSGYHLDTSITIPATGEQFFSRIWYRSARKGPAASLRLTLNTNKSINEDAYTTPVTIALSAGMDDPRFSVMNAFSRTLNVAEAEFFPGNAYLHPLNTDADPETEFFIRACQPMNSRELPIPEGNYILDYDHSTRQWTLKYNEDPFAFMKLIGGWHVLQLKVFFVCMALIGFVGSAAFNKHTIQVIQLIGCTGFIFIILPCLMYLTFPALVFLIGWLIVIRRRRIRIEG